MCAADSRVEDEDVQAVLEVTAGRGEAHVHCGCGELVPVTAANVIVSAHGDVAAKCHACAALDRKAAESAGAGGSADDGTLRPAAGLVDVESGGSDHIGVPLSAPSIWQRPPVWWRHTAAAAIIAGVAALATKANSDEPRLMAAMSSSPLVSAQDVMPGATKASGHVHGTEEQAAAGAMDDQAMIHEIEDNFGSDGLDLPPTMEDLLENSEEALEERLPILADWVFPVAGSTEEFPIKPGRRFGAPRTGVDRPECDRGHCGVDLNGPRGTPIVAVAWGQVVRVEQRTDRRSGKYVQIQHPDYVYTAYMHLDEIAPGLRVGDEVEAGQFLGTLGSTGVVYSAPHLHFSLEIPGNERLLAIDPEPYLQRATRLPIAFE